MEDEVDPGDAIDSLWDTLTEKFIVEAEEFGKSTHSLSHTL